MATDEQKHKELVQLSETLEMLDLAMHAMAAIQLLPYSDLTPGIWEKIQGSAGLAGEHLSMFHEIIKLGSHTIDEDALRAHFEAVMLPHM